MTASNQRVQLEPCLILHSRPFSNTSLIIEVLSQSHGKLALLARSARGLQSRFRSQLQLFTPLLLSWSGRNELKSLTQAEWQAPAYSLEGDALMCGFYLNELLQRLLHRDDPHPNLYTAYREALANLARPCLLEPVLRIFELRLLSELGYAPPLHKASDGSNLQASQRYQYIPDHGFVLSHANAEGQMIFSGHTLCAMASQQLEAHHLSEAKRLMRIALGKLLGSKPLKSRELL